MNEKAIQEIQPKYPTITIPQEEIDKIVSPDDFVPRGAYKKKKKLLKQIVHYMQCPTCGVVTGHRRKKGTLNDYPCCVCGHTIQRFSTDILVIAGLVSAFIVVIGFAAYVAYQIFTTQIFTTFSQMYGILPALVYCSVFVALGIFIKKLMFRC